MKKRIRKAIFSSRLKHVRTRLRGLTQTRLSKISGVGIASISNIENKNRSPQAETVVNLSKALNVTTDYLLGRSDAPISEPKNTDKLYRKIKLLTDRDRRLVESMIVKLIERNSVYRS